MTLKNIQHNWIYNYYNYIQVLQYFILSCLCLHLLNNILLITGFIYMRDKKKFAQITSLRYLIMLNSLSIGNSSDQNRKNKNGNEEKFLIIFFLSLRWVILLLLICYLKFFKAPYMNAFYLELLYFVMTENITYLSKVIKHQCQDNTNAWLSRKKLA